MTFLIPKKNISDYGAQTKRIFNEGVKQKLPDGDIKKQIEEFYQKHDMHIMIGKTKYQNCVHFALEKLKWDYPQDMNFKDMDSFTEYVNSGKNIEEIIRKEDVRAGLLITYFNDKNNYLHAGITEQLGDDIIVTSQWGDMNLVFHELDRNDSMYGDKYKLFSQNNNHLHEV